MGARLCVAVLATALGDGAVLEPQAATLMTRTTAIAVKTMAKNRGWRRESRSGLVNLGMAASLSRQAYRTICAMRPIRRNGA